MESTFIALNLIKKDTCTNGEAVHIWKNLDINFKCVDKSTFKNLQCAIQASTESLPFFSLPSGLSLFWKESDLGKKKNRYFLQVLM